MGHEILYLDYNENADRRKVQNELDTYVQKKCWQEGSSGLLNPIRWLDHICVDREEAVSYIQGHNRGYYDQVAVMYRVYPKLKPSKTMETLSKRLEAERDKLRSYSQAHSVSSFKAEFVGCPNCGSKLKKTLLKGESCPLCRTDLRSKTTLETIQRYENNIRELMKQIKAEERKQNEKAVKNSTIKWLVKIEYHI